MGCGAAEVTGLGVVCFVVINPCVLSLFFFCFINFPIYPPVLGQSTVEDALKATLQAAAVPACDHVLFQINAVFIGAGGGKGVGLCVYSLQITSLSFSSISMIYYINILLPSLLSLLLFSEFQLDSDSTPLKTAVHKLVSNTAGGLVSLEEGVYLCMCICICIYCM